jgi:hypothetical protein
LGMLCKVNEKSLSNRRCGRHGRYLFRERIGCHLVPNSAIWLARSFEQRLMDPCVSTIRNIVGATSNDVGRRGRLVVQQLNCVPIRDDAGFCHLATSQRSVVSEAMVALPCPSISIYLPGGDQQTTTPYTHARYGLRRTSQGNRCSSNSVHGRLITPGRETFTVILSPLARWNLF